MIRYKIAIEPQIAVSDILNKIGKTTDSSQIAHGLELGLVLI